MEVDIPPIVPTVPTTPGPRAGGVAATAGGVEAAMPQREPPPTPRVLPERQNLFDVYAAETLSPARDLIRVEPDGSVAYTTYRRVPPAQKTQNQTQRRQVLPSQIATMRATIREWKPESASTTSIAHYQQCLKRGVRVTPPSQSTTLIHRLIYSKQSLVPWTRSSLDSSSIPQSRILSLPRATQVDTSPSPRATQRAGARSEEDGL